MQGYICGEETTETASTVVVIKVRTVGRPLRQRAITFSNKNDGGNNKTRATHQNIKQYLTYHLALISVIITQLNKDSLFPQQR